MRNGPTQNGNDGGIPGSSLAAASTDPPPPLTADIAFKYVFGHEESTGILRSLLSAIQTDAGGEYRELCQTVGVNILDYVLYPDRPAMHTTFMLSATGEPDLRMTDDLLIHTIEMPKRRVSPRTRSPDSEPLHSQRPLRLRITRNHLKVFVVFEEFQSMDPRWSGDEEVRRGHGDPPGSAHRGKRIRHCPDLVGCRNAVQRFSDLPDFGLFVCAAGTVPQFENHHVA